jgi:hypothetical protein
LLGPLLHPEPPDVEDLDAAASSRLCQPGWHHADSSCFRIFGGVEQADWKSWPAAETHCQEFGGNLASVSTDVQNHATLAIAQGLTVWIGLSDQAEEGNFVWSDGEPSEFTNWANGEPNDLNSGNVGFCEGGADCVIISSEAQGQWAEHSCAIEGWEFEDFEGNRKAQWKKVDDGDACVPIRLPYICSKPSTPAAAHGGLMHGCKNGGWMMGTAHSNPDLPPTIVRFSFVTGQSEQLSCHA